MSSVTQISSNPIPPPPITRKEPTAQEKKEMLLSEVLDYATSGDLKPFIENIISGNLDVDQMDSRGYTAIHLAV